MMDNIFYQGENIPINIIGQNSELQDVDFVLLIYPHYDKQRVLEYRRADFLTDVVDGDTIYRMSVPWNVTKDMPVGDYCIEVMIAERGGYRSVHQHAHAFSVKFSNAKNY